MRAADNGVLVTSIGSTKSEGGNMFKRNSRRFGGALALVAALMAGNAAAESLTGAWRCTFTRTDKSTYRVVIKLTPTTGQWSDQPAAPLKVSGNEASFMTRLSTGTDGNMVNMTLRSE
ncbi:MAG: hypothetical protein AB7P50_15355, partial [Alphaproteobacteria bacterium]